MISTDRATQQRRILQLLVENPDGVSSFHLTFELRPGIKQAPTRIFELKRQGFRIESIPYRTESGVRTVMYRLGTPSRLIDWDALQPINQDAQKDLFN
jgi:hypothetical protein